MWKQIQYFASRPFSHFQDVQEVKFDFKLHSVWIHFFSSSFFSLLLLPRYTINEEIFFSSCAFAFCQTVLLFISSWNWVKYQIMKKENKV